MRFKVFSIVFISLLTAGSAVWAAAPQAILQSIKGKVEYRLPGTTSWVTATEGQTLNPATTLSTGFSSSVIVVIDKTTIQVRPLTRMTIDKLVSEGTTVKTSTFLQVGSVSVAVKSAEGLKQDFKVQSPYSTASVRGTEFVFTGLKLKVTEGLVSLVPGRPVRDLQADTLSPKEIADSFAGTPDTAADETKAVMVPAGTGAQLVLDFKGGGLQTQKSGDLNKLKQDSGLTLPPPPAPKGPPPDKGTLKITVIFGS